MTSRLAGASAAVVLLAVVLLGGLTWRTTGRDIARLTSSRRLVLAGEVAALLKAAYAKAGSWQRANLYPAQLLAAESGASLVVRDRVGAAVKGSGAPTPPLRPALRLQAAGAPLTRPLSVGGRTVGAAILHFRSGTPAAERRVRRSVERTVLLGGLLAASIAALIGALAARRITRPLRTLTAAAQAHAAGDRAARAGPPGPAELGELGRAFDDMAETVEREDALRRAFAADVAHELRTPLAIAQAEVEALVDGVAEPTPARLHSLHEEMLRLARIVEDVETLAAAEGARLRLARERIDLAETARETVALLEDQALESGVRLTAQLEEAQVNADPTRLEQIVRNLVANAIKFTPAPGEVTVAVRVARDEALLVVEDTGPGLAEDDIAHLFERFWRGQAAREAPGSGVGLAVAAELVRAHGGRIEAGNRPEGGARFTVSLPRA
jgi:signal transduction histidine kinase